MLLIKGASKNSKKQYIYFTNLHKTDMPYYIGNQINTAASHKAWLNINAGRR